MNGLEGISSSSIIFIIIFVIKDNISYPLFCTLDFSLNDLCFCSYQYVEKVLSSAAAYYFTGRIDHRLFIVSKTFLPQTILL